MNNQKTHRWVAAVTAIVLSMDITREELRQMMSEVFREELLHLQKFETSQKRFSIEEATSYLKRLGVETTINGLYTFLSRGKISADKINGKLSFERTELDRFAASRIELNSKQEAASRIRKSAIAKEKRASKTA